MRSRPAWVNPQWYDVRLSDPVRSLLRLRPGPDLLVALAGLVGGACGTRHEGPELAHRPRPGSVPGAVCECQLVVVAAWQAIEAWVSASRAANLVETMGGEPVLVGGSALVPVLQDPDREQVAIALRVSPGSSQNLIGSARWVRGYPQLMDLAERGACPFWAVRLLVSDLAVLVEAGLVDAAQQVADEVCSRVIARISEGNTPWNTTQIRAVAKRLINRALPADDVKKSHAEALEDRRVEVWPGENGMSLLGATISAIDAKQIHARLSLQAKALDDAGRSMDQKRADILVDTLLGSITIHPGQPGSDRADQSHVLNRSDAAADVVDAGAEAGSAGGTIPTTGPVRTVTSGRVEVSVLVTMGTLLGLDDSPALVPGIGSIPAATARELAADGHWRAWIKDATGNIISTSSATYRPSAGLARLVRAREPYCRMPGCRVPAARCDLDHTIAWPEGGTTLENLGPLCRRHHNLKTHFGWRFEPPGESSRHATRRDLEPGSASGAGPGTGDPDEWADLDPWCWVTPTGQRFTGYPEPPPF